MDKERARNSFINASEAAFDELQAWCQTHPKYTLLELEEQARAVRQRLMGEAMTSLVAQRGTGQPVEGVLCPKCGAKMEGKGQQARAVQGPEGSVTLSRAYQYCASCKEGFSPLDRELLLTRRPWTEAAERGMARLGALIPSYRVATETYVELVGLSVSASTLEEVTTLAGERLRDIEAAVAQASVALPGEEENVVAAVASGGTPAAKPDHLCISLDGTKVKTDEGWREVKVVSVSEGEELANPAADGTRVTLVNHSYRAGFWEAKEFGDKQWAEAVSRGVEGAKRVTSVNDGAPWIWVLILLCYPAALQVVDWWHAVDRLWKVANLVFGQGTEAAAVWMSARKDELWDGRVTAVIAALGTLEPRSEEAREEVRLLKEYLRTHAERMCYREFRESGAPVGSGTVESACKNVVGSRMKRGGMRWKVKRAEGVLALRCALLSGRWHEAWDTQRRAA